MMILGSVDCRMMRLLVPLRRMENRTKIGSKVSLLLWEENKLGVIEEILREGGRRSVSLMGSVSFLMQN